MRQGKSSVPARRDAAAEPAAKPEKKGRASRVRPRGEARQAIVDAARAEFDERGFEGTDTNRIARRAGYAPQTFYRHFRDKMATFLEVYRRWLDEEWNELHRCWDEGPEKAAGVLLEHHARHRTFRRSLRALASTAQSVRTARAESRRRQIERIDARTAAPGDSGLRVALLLAVERIADAAAEGELDDLGLDRAAQERLLAETIRRLGRSAPPVTAPPSTRRSR